MFLMIKHKSITALALSCLFFAGCATISPHDSHLREIGKKTFGPGANLQVYEITYAGPVSNALSTILGNSSEELSLVDAMKKANAQNSHLIIWCESSRVGADALLRALSWMRLDKKGLQLLPILFVGDPKDTARLKPAVESAGGVFYTHEM